MEAERRRLLEQVMAAVAAGDGEAVMALHHSFATEIRAAILHHVHAFGVAVPPDDLDGLVLEACLSLREVAGGWRPDGGALPWTWASARLRTLVSRFVGQHTCSLDAGHLQLPEPLAPVPVPCARDDDILHTLARVAAIDPRAALVEQALRASLSERDQSIFLEHRVQQDAGDPSPAHTVAAQHGMTAAAVRQVVCRARRRIAAWLSAHDAPSDIALAA